MHARALRRRLETRPAPATVRTGPPARRYQAVLDLQRRAGNHATTRLLLAQSAAGPVASPPAAAPPAQRPEDKEEYDLLRKHNRILKSTVKKFANLADYVETRNHHFGGEAAYDAAKADADAEFDAMPTWVKKRIGQKEPIEARKILYRWLRKAYVDAGITDPVAVIKAGMTPELKTKIDAVTAAHPAVKLGGFVARPQKLRGYRLGTLSEHATGRAVDVTPQDKNPHLPKSEWKFILEITGKSVTRSKSRWLKDPDALWQDIHDLNAAYVTELTARVAAERDARTKAGKDPDKPPSHRTVLAGNKTLIETADKHGVAHGFFSLPQDLVKAFAGQGLIWGATFPKAVDLHHFELP